MLHLFGCLYYCISDAWSYKHEKKVVLCRQAGRQAGMQAGRQTDRETDNSAPEIDLF